MRKKTKYDFICGFTLLALFILWTVLVSFANVQPIGPKESEVGLASINGLFHKLTGVHMWMYELTDLLSLIPLAIIVGFGLLGLVQWIGRKSFLKVDFSILALGGFYVVVLAAFAFFEVVVINYRPVLIEGVLEASYPSSTTMLMMCVMPTAMMQFQRLIENKALRRTVSIACIIFTAFMVIFRLISGVHWLTDIFGGAVLSTALVILYKAVCGLEKKQ
jgi:undecaprenyl-diphosphatase